MKFISRAMRPAPLQVSQRPPLVLKEKVPGPNPRIFASGEGGPPPPEEVADDVEGTDVGRRVERGRFFRGGIGALVDFGGGGGR